MICRYRTVGSCCQCRERTRKMIPPNTEPATTRRSPIALCRARNGIEANPPAKAVKTICHAGPRRNSVGSWPSVLGDEAVPLGGSYGLELTSVWLALWCNVSNQRAARNIFESELRAARGSRCNGVLSGGPESTPKLLCDFHNSTPFRILQHFRHT